MKSTPLNESKIKVPYLRDLSQTLNSMLQDGYDKNFKANENGLECLETQKTYQPGELQVVNFYRFEGISDPSDNSILYVIETADGVKGTLVDAYGAYSDPLVEKFMKQVKIEEKE
jgi:hypothetical protein